MSVQPSQSESTHPWPEVKLQAVSDKAVLADIREPRYRNARAPGEVDALVGTNGSRDVDLAATQRRKVRDNLIARMQHYGYGFLTEEEARCLLGMS